MPQLKQKLKLYKPYARAIFALVEKYEKIAVYAHRSPDFDAFGSQFALASFIKEHYPNKDVVVLGEVNDFLISELYPELDSPSAAWFSAPYLSLVVDTGNTARISDKSYEGATEIVKIDHHPNVEPYGELVFVDDKAVAVSEILALLFMSLNKKISKTTATYLYTGIVGDSGRFRYRSTTALTFIVVSHLLNAGVDIGDVYNKMYALSENELKVQAFILNNYEITKDGFAYYKISDSDLAKLNVSVEIAKDQVNIFSSIKGVKVWAAIVENKERKEWRVSLRSKDINISSFAAKWHGGGHAQASGASLYTDEDFPVFINEINEFIRNNS